MAGKPWWDLPTATGVFGHMGHGTTHSHSTPLPPSLPRGFGWWCTLLPPSPSQERGAPLLELSKLWLFDNGIGDAGA